MTGFRTRLGVAVTPWIEGFGAAEPRWDAGSGDIQSVVIGSVEEIIQDAVMDLASDLA